VHRAAEGDTLTVGVVGGLMGEAIVRRLAPQEVVLEVQLHETPPAALGVDLLLAIPRPKILKKVLPAAASIGVKRIILVNSARVEKSYFSSPTLEPAALRELLLLGLEQGRDTVLPDIQIRPRFRPFVEDEVDALWPLPTARLIAHPTSAAPLQRVASRAVVAIGPEGGWVPFEIELLEKQGFFGFSLGPRILRVDTAVPFILGQLALLQR
jgi:RsmE family RNA methyltransferase